MRKSRAQIEAAAEKKPSKQTPHSGTTPENANLEQNVLSCVLKSRAADSFVTTDDIICKAVSLDAQFKNGDTKKMHKWVYKSMARNNFCVRTATRIAQKTAVNMKAVKRDYSHRVNMFYFSLFCNPRYFVNMDETQSLLQL